MGRVICENGVVLREVGYLEQWVCVDPSTDGWRRKCPYKSNHRACRLLQLFGILFKYRRKVKKVVLFLEPVLRGVCQELPNACVELIAETGLLKGFVR